MMCKMKFALNGVVGHPYGSSFIVRDGQLVKASSCDLSSCSADQGLLMISDTKLLVKCNFCFDKKI